MKNTFYYNFLPSKSEELACIANNTSYKPTRVLIEIRDIYPPPVIDYRYPWQIKQKLSMYEIASGKLVISFNDTFDHIFRYWSLSMANHVVLGHKALVFLWDVSEQKNPKKYYGDNVYFEMLPNDDYILVCKDLFQDRSLSIDDEIGLFFDPRGSCFQFKLLSKAK